MQETTRLIAVGASVISDISTPFTETVSNEMNKEYIQYADTGISNETIFRWISYANIKYNNAIIMPVFTYLVREELVDVANIAHIAMPSNTINKHGRKKQTEYFYHYIWNEKQASARFWNRLYDAKIATKHAGNTLISVWDSSYSYNIDVDTELNKSKLPNLHTDLFRTSCLDENAFTDFFLEEMETSSESDYHMSQESHNYVAKVLLKGNPND